MENEKPLNEKFDFLNQSEWESTASGGERQMAAAAAKRDGRESRRAREAGEREGNGACWLEAPRSWLAGGGSGLFHHGCELTGQRVSTGRQLPPPSPAQLCDCAAATGG
ncbi:unnamed protein product [Pleuronectes platessa]|uniref:Uncharacterized protein n=1 Tax=Pleuronectes platessa TaxID=8262 RepID=A0A9N7YTI0_PLEPL|nr:unnamed protein product [Pleuronectes platessa]